MAAGGGGAQPRATERETTLWFLLHHLEEQGISVYSLSAKQTIHGVLAAAAWSSWHSTTSHGLTRAQGVALKLRLIPLKLFLCSITSDGGESRSRSNFYQVLGFGACGIKFDEHGPLFIGLLVPSHRGCRELSFLSSNQTQTRLRSEDIGKGMIHGLVTIRVPVLRSG
jgi:hypothetical protein